MVECPSCKNPQPPSSTKVTRDGSNVVVEYLAKCVCGQAFSGWWPLITPAQN